MAKCDLKKAGGGITTIGGNTYMMKKRLMFVPALFAMLLGMTGCAKNDSYAHIKSHLKDPDSFKVYNCESVSDDKCTVYKIEYNAKNSFGAYTGRETVYALYDKEDDSWECSYCEVLEGYCLTAYVLIELSK